MHKLLQTGAALAVILLLGLTVSGAQEDADDGLETNESDELLLSSGMEDIPLSEMIQLYSEYSGRAVMYDSSRIDGSVSVVAPRDGVNVTAEDALRSALSEFRIALVSDGVFDRVVPATEALTMAETVDRSELSELPAMKFVRIAYPLTYNDANAVRGAIQNLMSRHGGVVSPVQGSNALVISDFVANTREILALLDKLEAVSADVSRIVVLENTSFDQINAVIHSVVRPPDQGRQRHESYPRISSMEDMRTLVVTGKVAEVERIVGVIKQLDQPQE